ncbi:hypothetical protein GGX14DRAFT_643128 [Mycena pura]|uniref:Uncharacterized protein n=1 Tax=Mycena pura TaxID=153505 RepID=A0AAD6YQG9_9AGAR|nr:hypothetical protein GGX14DRAFT_643128 [Mycena pura]
MSTTVTSSQDTASGPSNLIPPAPFMTSTPAAPPHTPSPSSMHEDPYADERSTWIKNQDEEPTFIINEKQELSFPPLVDLSDPIPNDQTSLFSRESVIFHLPTVMPEYRTINNLDVHERRTTALLIGATALQKRFLLASKVAPRRFFERIFKQELELLEECLTHVEQSPRTLSSEQVYRLRAENYNAIINALSYHLGQAKSSFKLAGKKHPILPCWASETSHIEDWSNINDFEILAICFRYEVENFLVSLDKVYDFKNETPKPFVTSVPDEDEIEDAPTISSTQNKSMATDKGVQSFQRDVPPHMDIPGMRQNKGKGKETIGEYDSVTKHLYNLSAKEIQTPILIQMMRMVMSLIVGDYLLIVQDKGLVEMAMVVMAMEMVDLEVLEEETMVLHTQGTPVIQGILMVLVIQI